jgi:hypothetical protein
MTSPDRKGGVKPPPLRSGLVVPFACQKRGGRPLAVAEEFGTGLDADADSCGIEVREDPTLQTWIVRCAVQQEAVIRGEQVGAVFLRRLSWNEDDTAVKPVQ